MTEKEKMLNNYLLRIASNLDISETMREKAETSYRAVGQWLGDCDDDSEVKIMPQGSFYLGTVIRPVSDADEYDIDLVCLLKNAKYKSEAEIKNIVGNRLKEHKTYMIRCFKRKESVAGHYVMMNSIWTYCPVFLMIAFIANHILQRSN